MSRATIAFSVYFVTGLLLMVIAVASRGKEKLTKGFEATGCGDEFDAGLLIFIALLWPIWIFTSLINKSSKP